jgi:hypothetical protein
VVVHRRQHLLDLGERLAFALVPLDRDQLREVARAVQRGAAAQRRPIEEAEGRVVADAAFVGDRSHLTVLRCVLAGEALLDLLAKLTDGPRRVHPANVTLSYNTVNYLFHNLAKSIRIIWCGWRG